MIIMKLPLDRVNLLAAILCLILILSSGIVGARWGHRSCSRSHAASEALPLSKSLSNYC